MGLRDMTPEEVRTDFPPIPFTPVRTVRVYYDGAVHEHQMHYVRGLDGKRHPSIRVPEYRADRDALIRRRRSEGASVRTIAAEVGVSVGTVHRVIKAAGGAQTAA